VPAIKYRIGVDGGGTKTDYILLDQSGNMVGGHTGPGCNPSILGEEQAVAVIAKGLQSLRAQVDVKDLPLKARRRAMSPISHTLLCMAGHRGFWQELAKRLVGFGRVTVTDDSLPALELATYGMPGIVLHAGTGSFVAARAPDGTVHYAGGRGWRFGDPGSAYDLGQRAIARALLELQGWAPPSGLGPAVRESTGIRATANASAVTRYFYQHPNPNLVIAGLAPAVLRLAQDKDEAAHGLVTASANELMDLAVSVATKLFPAKKVSKVLAGLSGPILIQPVVYDALAARSPFVLLPVSGSPIEGVRRLLARL